MVVDGSGNVFVTGQSHDGGSTAGYDGYDGYATIKYSSLLTITLTQPAAANGQLRFQFNADSNLTYAVEYRDSLNPGNWLTLTNIAAQPAATNIAVINAITNNARFYRVRIP